MSAASAEAVRVVAARSSADIEAARELFRLYAASLPFDLAFQGFEAELAGLPAPYVEPYGCLLLAKRERLSVGVVGLKPLGDAIAEIKRLYVVPGARGSGIGTALFRGVLREAQQRGYDRIRLDSHRASMTAAIAMYAAFGFTEIPPYGPDLNRQIVFFEKRLRP